MKTSAYKRAMERIALTEEQQARITQNILRAQHQSNRRIPMLQRKKTILIAAALTAVLGVSALAYSGVITAWYSSSDSEPEYTELPTAEQIMADAELDFAPRLIEQFENGYAFQEGSIVSNSLTDDSGNAVERFPSIEFRYEKDGDEVWLVQAKYTSEVEESGEIIAGEDGIDYRYTSYTTKFVPADYEQTEADAEAEASGELVFSYGSDEVQTIRQQALTWEQGGVHYQLMQSDGRLTQDELLDMARQLTAG